MKTERQIGNRAGTSKAALSASDSRANRLLRAHAPRLIYAAAGLMFLWLFLVIPRTVWGDTYKGEELLRQMSLAPWKVGPFRIRPEIILSDLGYDSNIYSQPEAVGDYRLTVGPSFTGYLAIRKKIVLKLYESPRYVYFYETTRERAWNNYFRADANILLNKMFLSAGAAWTDARERWNYEIDLRPRRKQADVQASALLQMGKKTGFSVDISASRIRYENLEFEHFPIAQELDRDEFRAAGGFYQQMTPRIRAFVQLEYGRFDFRNPLNPRDAETRTAYAGFEFSPGGRVNGRVRLGYKTLYPLNGTKPDFQGLVGDSSVSIDIARPIRLRGSYRRDVQFSLWINARFFIENMAGGGLSLYIFKHKVRLDYDYNLVRNAYRPASGEAGAGDFSMADKFTMQSAGLYFRLKKNIGLGITAGRWDRKTDLIGWNYGWRSKRQFANLNL
ncbi:MAG: outer membrane beta-barrel protein, partial [Candidatus Aminicenantes bacterium]|nr:outer membrane beta-barrel protein [Candidatus Aminicenantes bacterium]